AVFDRWRERAVRQLEHGYQYITALRSARLRIACFLPWYLGLRTLALLGQPGALEREEKIKVSRSAVRSAFILAIICAFSEKALAWANARAMKEAGFAPTPPPEPENPEAEMPGAGDPDGRG